MFSLLTTPYKICNTGALSLSNAEVFPVRQRLMIVVSALYGWYMSFVTIPNKVLTTFGFSEIEPLFIQLTIVSFVFVKSDGVPELLDVNGWNGGGSGEIFEEVGVLQDVHCYLEYGIGLSSFDIQETIAFPTGTHLLRGKICSSERVGGESTTTGTSGALIFASAIETAHIHPRRHTYRKVMLDKSTRSRVR
ncbi:hypothetical protein Tco_0993689 [Tanacetum coccineum]